MARPLPILSELNAQMRAERMVYIARTAISALVFEAQKRCLANLQTKIETDR